MPTRRSARLNALSLALFLSFPAFGAKAYEVLPAKKIAALKSKPCTLIHVWATWCVPCIDELPKFIQFIQAQKKVTPVIIDVSEPFVQDQFSKKWLTQLAPPFVTYLKPKGSNKAYYSSIDKDWKDKLPYNALYDGGKKKAVWTGTQDFKKLEGEITRLCR